MGEPCSAVMWCPRDVPGRQLVLPPLSLLCDMSKKYLICVENENRRQKHDEGMYLSVFVSVRLSITIIIYLFIHQFITIHVYLDIHIVLKSRNERHSERLDVT